MKVMIIGCGRVGAQLASRLHAQGHQVTVIDITPTAFQNLDPSFRGRTLEGDVLGQDMLRRAGIESMDALAAVTNSDTLNAVVAHIARDVYHVVNVLARNYEPRLVAIHEAFGLQSVSSSSWGAQRMEEMLTDASLLTVFSAGNGEVEVYEVLVPQLCDGKRLGDVANHGACIAVALTRAGKAVLPSPDMMLQAGRCLACQRDLRGCRDAAQAACGAMRRVRCL